MEHVPTGTTVTSLRGALDGASPDDQFLALERVLDWLRGFGVAPGSISSMAWSLWRASLSRPVSIGADPEVSRRAFFGGRQEARIRTDDFGNPVPYQHMVAVDLRSAYPTSMAQAPYALSLRSVSPSSDLDPDVPGLAVASVTVPRSLPYSPLPVRLAPSVISYQSGPIRGTWTWVELVAARDLGCDVTVTESWAPRATFDLFGSWWAMVQSGRELPGVAATLAKAIHNSTWGQFAMEGEDRGVTQWIDEAGHRTLDLALPGQAMPHKWMMHVAAETTARVRVRLLLEGIYGSGRGYPVHVDTDGYVVRKSRPDPARTGESCGDWRRKSSMRSLDLRGPQLYRWTCGRGCGVAHAKWHYCAAGVPASAAPSVFENEGGVVMRTTNRGLFDITLPSTHSADWEAIAKYLAETNVRSVA